MSCSDAEADLLSYEEVDWLIASLCQERVEAKSPGWSSEAVMEKPEQMEAEGMLNDVDQGGSKK